MDNTDLLARCYHRVDPSPPLSGFSVGYELKVWRQKDLVASVFKHLPSFALRHTERMTFSDQTAVDLLRRAAHKIYATDNYGRRGEFGELLLHCILERHFQTVPAVSKIYYKDAANDTVKGFDAVHAVDTGDALELWLGEVKFYKDLRRAIRDIVAELYAHSKRDYLRSEFPAIADKIDPNWPHADRLHRLLDPDVSLDTVFDRTRFPVLLTYDSDAVQSHSTMCKEYLDAMVAEFGNAHNHFLAASPPSNLSIELLLVPVADKERLAAEFDTRLKAWQHI